VFQTFYLWKDLFDFVAIVKIHIPMSLVDRFIDSVKERVVKTTKSKNVKKET
jgi:hypothetical protein